MNTSPEHFERLVRYNRGANRRVAEMLTELKGAEVKRPLELFSHLLRAERVWLGRTYATPDAALPLWETDPLGRCRERLEANARAFEQLVADGSADTEPVTYTTTQGTTYATPVRDILAHVLNHATHHRGQIALLVREAGHTPQPLDLTFYLRLS